MGSEKLVWALTLCLTLVASASAQQVAGPPGISAVITASQFGASPTVALGSFIEIYGSNLGPNPGRTWTASDFDHSTAPISLDGVSVTLGGQTAFVEYVGLSQVNVQVPSTAPTGLQSVVVTTSAGASTPFMVTINAVQPALYASATSKYLEMQYISGFFPDGTPVFPEGAIPCTPTRSAQPGDTIIFYGVGFGPVSPNTPAGQIAPANTSLISVPSFVFGGTPGWVAYAGLVTGLVGLYQFNVVVPNISGSVSTPLNVSLPGSSVSQRLVTALQGSGPVVTSLSVALMLAGTGTGTVTLSGPAPAGGALVAITSDSAASTVGYPGSSGACSIVVPANSTSASFTLVDPIVTQYVPASIATYTASYNGSSINFVQSVQCYPGSSGKDCP